jgi:hypothetical protein
MKNIKEILKPSFRLFRDNEHYEYHNEVLKFITPVLTKEYKLESERFDYEKLFKKEEKAYMRDRAFEETKEIQAADKKRDELFCFIKRTIELIKFNPDAEIKVHWVLLDQGLSSYRNAHRKSFLENTILVTEFINEMSQDKYAKPLETLDLQKVFILLKEANDKCENLYNERLNAKEKRDKEEKIRKIRPDVDKRFFFLIKCLNSIYLVNEIIMKDMQIQTEIGYVIDNMNVLTSGFKTNIKERRGELGDADDSM